MKDNYGYEGSRGDILDMLNELKEIVSNAKGVLLSDNCLVNREQFLHLLGMITNNLPDELKRAKWVVENQHQFENQARQEASRIMIEAENRAVLMINEHEITLQAQEYAERLVREAEEQAQDLQARSLQYVRDRLEQADESLTNLLVELRRDKQELS